jgi:hypothetical protein
MERADRRHVLDGDVARSKLANDASELGPESSLRVSEASPLPGAACALAGESADDPVNRGEGRGAGGADVIVNRDAWPSSVEQSAAELVTLNEPGVPDSCLVESCVEQASA